jgi:GH24 family phage-related lysozyme (muramidase)
VRSCSSGILATAQSTVASAVTAKLTDGQFAALVDFVFNVGGANFRNSSLLRVVNAGEDEQCSGAITALGVREGKAWPGLQTRREGEIDLYFEGLPRPPASTELVTPIDILLGETPGILRKT